MNKKGNVSILVMFIMIATSLMGLLAMHFVQQMMEYSSVVHDYYKTYYLTKAGIEIGLAESNQRGLGFSTTISSGFYASNMLCGERCEITSEVKGKALIAREKFWNEEVDCTTGNAYSLKQNEQIIVPLFYEKSLNSQKQNLEEKDSLQITPTYSSNGEIGDGEETEYEGFSKEKIEKIIIDKRNSQNDFEINMGILALEKREDGQVGEYDSDIVYFQKVDVSKESIKTFFDNFSDLYSDVVDTHFFYLMIGNANEKTLRFCLKTKNNSYSNNSAKIPMQRFWMESVAQYDDNIMSMEALYKQGIPNIFTDVGGFN